MAPISGTDRIFDSDSSLDSNSILNSISKTNVFKNIPFADSKSVPRVGLKGTESSRLSKKSIKARKAIPTFLGLIGRTFDFAHDNIAACSVRPQ